jgi:aromatic ring-opening dioxygenase catalytic subunit (LigB family)
VLTPESDRAPGTPPTPAVFVGHGSPMNALEKNRYTQAWATFGDRSRTWSVLVHAFPAADVPVVQLSINALKDFDFHVELGARLAPLRERGVLIVGSGNIVHNLRVLDWSQPDLAFDWARRFDDTARAVLTEDTSGVPGLESHPDFERSVPTPDHFIPMLYIAGLAGAAGRPLHVLVDGYAFGSISMASYTLDATCPTEQDTRPSAGLPDRRSSHPRTRTSDEMRPSGPGDQRDAIR